eukprot:14657627-Ditylum_brightwellii.AAC.1
MIENAQRFLPHKCNSRCQACIAPGAYRCCKLNNLKVTTDSTKHVFTPLPNNISDECIQRLAQCGLAEVLEVNENGFTHTFKNYISYFHPRLYIPLTNLAGGMNISPMIG